MQKEQAEDTFQGQGSRWGTSGYPDPAHGSSNSHFLSMTSSNKDSKDLKRSETMGFRRGYLEKPNTMLCILPLLFPTHSPSSKEQRCGCLPLNSGPRKGLQQSNLERVRYSLVTQTVKNLPAMQETRVWSLGQEDPLEKEMAVFLRSGFLPGEAHRQRSLAGYSLWGHKESDTTEWLTLFFHFQGIYATVWEKTAWYPNSPGKLKI